MAAVDGGATIPVSSGYWAEVTTRSGTGRPSVVHMEMGYGPAATRLVFLGQRAGGSRENDVSESDILERLRKVEGTLGDLRVDVGRIQTSLASMPTTNKMWGTMALTAVVIIGGMWAVLTFAGPGILKAAIAEVMNITPGG